MEAHNIKPLKLPPKYSRPIKLDGIKDPKLPRQIAEELAERNDVLEVAYFPPAQTKVKGEYRIKLKSSDEFNIFILYCYIIVVFVINSFFTIKKIFKYD